MISPLLKAKTNKINFYDKITVQSDEKSSAGR